MIMKHSQKWIAAAIVTLCFTACKKEISQPQTDDMITQTSLEDETGVDSRHGHGNNDRDGQVFTLNNQVSDNKVIAYRRGQDGKLVFQAAYSTGGKGTGAGLGSQGSVILSDDENILLAVNAGNNTISSFRITGNHLTLACKISSGGTTPISITEHNHLVYVLNAGANGNIAGFRLFGNGSLSPIPFSKKSLSSSTANPAQISFVNDGGAVVVTEKGTNKIISYTISPLGFPGAFHSLVSANPTPFGFAVKGNGNIIVSEAAGGAAGASTVSSYRVHPDGSITLIEGPIAAGQTAACWVVVTDNNKYVYATNTGSNTVSSFKSGFNGGLDLLNAVAAPSGTTPIDADLSDNSNYLYVLNAGSTNISAYKVKEDGSLNSIQTVQGLSAGVVGLAAK